MQFQNKNQIAWLTALTLLFSYAEMLLPRTVPFFRLGLGNAVILAALNLNLNFSSFFLLTILKSISASLMAGTLFSPFLLLSLTQSVFSGLLMYFLFRLNRLFRHRPLSLYGISLAGAAFSALVQIFLSSLYLGAGTMSLLGPMLLFSVLSGIITAITAEFFFDLKDGESLPLVTAKTAVSQGSTTVLSSTTPSAGTPRNAPSRRNTVILASAILIFAASVFFIKPLIILAAAMLISLILQKISGRKIQLLPHLSLWLFVIISSLFLPEGKIIYKIGNLPVTQGALLSGITKAIRLSTVSALSQCAAGLRPSGNSLIAITLDYYRQMQDTFQKASGNLIHRIRKAVNQHIPQQNQKEQ